MLIIFNVLLLTMFFIEKRIYKSYITPFIIVASIYLFLIDLNNLIICNIYAYYKVSNYTLIILLGFLFLVFCISCFFGYFYKRKQVRKVPFSIEQRVGIKWIKILFYIGLIAYILSVIKDINVYGLGNIKGKASGILGHLSQLGFLIAPLYLMKARTKFQKFTAGLAFVLVLIISLLYGGKYGILVNCFYVLLSILIHKKITTKKLVKCIILMGIGAIVLFLIIYAIIPLFRDENVTSVSEVFSFAVEHFFSYLLAPVVANNDALTNRFLEGSQYPFTVPINIIKALLGNKDYVNSIFPDSFSYGMGLTTNVAGFFGELVYCIGNSGAVIYTSVLFVVIYWIYIKFRLTGKYRLTISYLCATLVFSFFANMFILSGIVLPILFLFVFETYFQIIRRPANAKRVSNYNLKLERN